MGKGSLLICILFVLTLTINSAFGQSGVVKGRVFNQNTNEPIPFANLLLDSTRFGASSDVDGNFIIGNIPPGVYNLRCVSIGFSPRLISEIRVGSKSVNLEIGLKERLESLDEVVVRASPFLVRMESPTSVRNISATEIYRSPGGNRDISRVIQNLPGVASGLSFRNDVIVRGGAPNENRFFIDGVEVPNINHFSTQGSSGGPVGLLNVNLIDGVNFYSSAFPVNKGNALSSVIDVRLISGNPDQLKGIFSVGSSDVGLTLDGPLGKRSNFILSVRRSYLQLLFKALALPFLPTYNDFQYKQEIRLNQKNQITLLGLGAIDDFALNKSVNDNVTDSTTFARNQYILGNLPVNEQWNYTAGLVWKHYSKNGYQRVVLSRNHLRNTAIKYKDNIEQPENLLLDYSSDEIENKFRFEHNFKLKNWRLLLGTGYQYVIYKNQTNQQLVRGGQVQNLDYTSRLTPSRYALFGQASRTFLREKLSLSVGLRVDASDYNPEMLDILGQLAPNIGLSYQFRPKWKFNLSVGRYNQLPPYTLMGFIPNEGSTNRELGLGYIKAMHYTGGFNFQPKTYTQVSTELFFKTYSNYPFLINRGISLANVPADFGVLGNEAAISISSGRSYGLEVLIQQKLSTSWFGILSYTWVRSEFDNGDGVFAPSAWDNRHIINLTAGRKFNRNWELGLRFRMLGGAPYTPYNRDLTLQQDVWDARQQALLDYSRLNALRNPLAYGLDVRIDKTFYFNKWSINVYLDIQNITNAKIESQPFVDVQRDDLGNPIPDPQRPNYYLGRQIENTSGTVLPSIGLQIEF